MQQISNLNQIGQYMGYQSLQLLEPSQHMFYNQKYFSNLSYP